MSARDDEQPAIDVGACVASGVITDSIDEEIGTAELVIGKEPWPGCPGLDGERSLLHRREICQPRLGRLQASQEEVVELMSQDVGGLVGDAKRKTSSTYQRRPSRRRCRRAAVASWGPKV
jgi:hypothetical protein